MCEPRCAGDPGRRRCSGDPEREEAREDAADPARDSETVPDEAERLRGPRETLEAFLPRSVELRGGLPLGVAPQVVSLTGLPA